MEHRVAPAELSPDAMERRMRGLEILQQHGLLNVAGVVMTCPDAKGRGAEGTVADALGMGNSDIDANFKDIVDGAKARDADLEEAVLLGFGMVIKKDEQRQPLREDLSSAIDALAQKKTLNPAPTS